MAANNIYLEKIKDYPLITTYQNPTPKNWDSLFFKKTTSYNRCWLWVWKIYLTRSIK